MVGQIGTQQLHSHEEIAPGELDRRLLGQNRAETRGGRSGDLSGGRLNIRKGVTFHEGLAVSPKPSPGKRWRGDRRWGNALWRRDQCSGLTSPYFAGTANKRITWPIPSADGSSPTVNFPASCPMAGLG